MRNSTTNFNFGTSKTLFFGCIHLSSDLISRTNSKSTLRLALSLDIKDSQPAAAEGIIAPCISIFNHLIQHKMHREKLYSLDEIAFLQLQFLLSKCKNFDRVRTICVIFLFRPFVKQTVFRFLMQRIKGLEINMRSAATQSVASVTIFFLFSRVMLFI